MKKKKIDKINIFTALVDFLVIFLGFFLAERLRFANSELYKFYGVKSFVVEFYHDVPDYSGIKIWSTLLLFCIFVNRGIYNHVNYVRYARTAKIIVYSILIWAPLVLLISVIVRVDPPISRLFLIISVFVNCLVMLIWRWVFARFLLGSSVYPEIKQRVLFVGWSDKAEAIWRASLNDKSFPYHVCGIIKSNILIGHELLPDGVVCFGGLDEIGDVIDKNNIELVVLVESAEKDVDMVRVMNICEKKFVGCMVVPSYFQILLSNLNLETICGVPVLGLHGVKLLAYSSRFVKRAIDVVGSLIGILCLFPIAIIFGLLVFIESPGPVLFFQERVGRGGCRFMMIKLRSMQIGANKSDGENQSTLRDDPRLLKIGRFIRMWNIDEIPQFWNVLCGDMSLVGPRPERSYFSDKLSDTIPHYSARLWVKPGMTGWAQVHGLRGDTDLSERIRFDLYYIDKWSVMLDFQIMLMTFFARSNAY